MLGVLIAEKVEPNPKNLIWLIPAEGSFKKDTGRYE